MSITDLGGRHTRGLGVPESPDPLVISESGGPDLLHKRLLEGSVADGIHDMTEVTWA
jgi:hypothetical protein